jgi:hypothetical protein
VSRSVGRCKILEAPYWKAQITNFVQNTGSFSRLDGLAGKEDIEAVLQLQHLLLVLDLWRSLSNQMPNSIASEGRWNGRVLFLTQGVGQI